MSFPDFRLADAVDILGQSLTCWHVVVGDQFVFTLHLPIDIEHDGAVVATVHRAVLSPLHHRAHVGLRDGGGRLEAVGNIIDKDFGIRDGHHVMARISRKWLRVRDTYGMDVAPGQNDALMITIAVCLDRIHHDAEERHG